MPKLYKTMPYSIFTSVFVSQLAGANTINNTNKSNAYFDIQFPLLTPEQVVDACENKKQRQQWLETQITHHRANYYQGKIPEITDAEFDLLLAELAVLSNCNAAAISQIGHTDNLTNKVTLHSEMRSLRSVRDEYVMAQFYRQHQQSELILQPKVDGLAVELVYQKGILISAATRGDGQQGKDIRELVLAMEAVPNQLDNPISMVLHGELYVTEQRWQQRDKYVSARHMAAGIAHQKQPSKDDVNNLSFVPWRWVDSPFDDEQNSLVVLSELGFEDMALMSHQVSSIADIQRWYAHYNNPKMLAVKLDGIVVKLADRHAQNSLGYNQQAPKWAMAQKFVGPRGVSKVTAIHYQIGATGRVTPVILFQPLILAGHTINKASGHSQPWLDKVKLVVGSEVEIELVGSAIPQVIRVFKAADN